MKFSKFNFYLKFLLFALFIGLYSVIFAKSVDAAFNVFLLLVPKLHYWLLIFVPFGFCLITYLVKRYFPEAEGSGIPQALAIDSVKDVKKLNSMFYPRLIVSKFLVIVAGTFFGATIGREGPTIQVGASILSSIGNKFSLQERKLLLQIGAAAGLSAAFNTPLGGIVFAMEELFKNNRLKLSLAKITVIVASGMISVAIIGNNSYFGRVERDLLFYSLWKIIPLTVIIGILSGLLAYGFSKTVYYTTIDKQSRYNQWRGKYPLTNSLMCGFLAAAIGLLSHGLSFGNGYHESILALSGKEQLPDLYFLYKVVSSLLSTSSGVPGGYFATSLSIGNGIGSLVHALIPLDIPIQQYYLLGMVAFLAALTQAPITAVTMVLQITFSQVFILPLLLTALIATYIANYFDESIYHYQIKKFLD